MQISKIPIFDHLKIEDTLIGGIFYFDRRFYLISTKLCSNLPNLIKQSFHHQGLANELFSFFDFRLVSLDIFSN